MRRCTANMSPQQVRRLARRLPTRSLLSPPLRGRDGEGGREVMHREDVATAGVRVSASRQAACCSLPPCGGELERGVARRCTAKTSPQRVASRPPPPPRKGEGKSALALRKIIVTVVLTIVTDIVTYSQSSRSRRTAAGGRPAVGARAVPAGGVTIRTRAVPGITQDGTRTDLSGASTGLGQVGRVTPA